MSLDLTNPSEVKIGLLSRGVDCDPNVFASYDRDFYSNLYVYGNTSVLTLQSKFPQVLLLGNSVVSAFIRREGSPWYLRVEDGDNVRLYHKGAYVQDVTLPEKPAYYGRMFSDGSLSDNVIAVAYYEPYLSLKDHFDAYRRVDAQLRYLDANFGGFAQTREMERTRLDWDYIRSTGLSNIMRFAAYSSIRNMERAAYRAFPDQSPAELWK
ncbi:MAG TPA: hypothetical protein VJB05_03435 [archaeon]|nr:hypothetical protein [archaeon]